MFGLREARRFGRTHFVAARWQSLCREQAILKWQREPPPHIDQRLSERVD
jgi:hypothetical protein